MAFQIQKPMSSSLAGNPLQIKTWYSVAADTPITSCCPTSTTAPTCVGPATLAANHANPLGDVHEAAALTVTPTGQRIHRMTADSGSAANFSEVRNVKIATDVGRVLTSSRRRTGFLPGLGCFVRWVLSLFTTWYKPFEMGGETPYANGTAVVLVVFRFDPPATFVPVRVKLVPLGPPNPLGGRAWSTTLWLPCQAGRIYNYWILTYDDKMALDVDNMENDVLEC